MTLAIVTAAPEWERCGNIDPMRVIPPVPVACVHMSARYIDGNGARSDMLLGISSARNCGGYFSP